MIRRERGSVLLLFPAGVLVVLVLAAMAVDSSIAFLGERELSNAVTAAANDAATQALSDPAFYRGGSVDVADGEVARIVEERVRTSLDPDRYHNLFVRAWVERWVLGGLLGCRLTLRVEASATVRYLFATALPGGPDEARVAASASSHPVQEAVGC